MNSGNYTTTQVFIGNLAGVVATGRHWPALMAKTGKRERRLDESIGNFSSRVKCSRARDRGFCFWLIERSIQIIGTVRVLSTKIARASEPAVRPPRLRGNHRRRK